MKLIISADDLGRSQAVTDNIFSCFNGVLSSTSIMANGDDYDRAIAVFRRDFIHHRLSIHLNLTEGRACLPAEAIPNLVDADGYFRHSFFSLLVAYYRGSPAKRRVISAQVESEIKAQIDKVCREIGNTAGINVDGHQHIHTLPFVFHALLKIGKTLPIDYVRLPREKFFLLFNRSTMFNYLGPNLIKHVLLNFLSSRCARFLRQHSIACNDYFIGVLFTGNMSLASIKKAIAAIKDDNDNMTVEILLHPGGSREDEATYWKKHPSFRAYYLSDNREKERALLQSGELSDLTDAYTAPER